MKKQFVCICALLLASSTLFATPTVKGNTISWPADGWYQVQRTEDYVSVCEGGSTCTVDAGNYHVINHSTSQRYEHIVVNGKTNSSLPDILFNVSIRHYSLNLAELFWNRPNAIEKIVSIEIIRDGESIGVTEGTGFLDSTRTSGVSHHYELLAIDVNGNRSPPATLGFYSEQQKLVSGGPGGRLTFDTQNVFLSGNSAIVVAEKERIPGGTGAVYVFSRDATGTRNRTQRLVPDQGVFAGEFGESLAIDGSRMVIIEDTGTELECL